MKVSPQNFVDEVPAGFDGRLIDISKCQILQSFVRLRGKQLKYLDKRCAKKYMRYRTNLEKIHKEQRSQETIEMQQEKYRTNVFDLLQRDLDLTFKIRDSNLCNAELAQVLIFYLCHRLKPEKYEQRIIRRLNDFYATIEIHFGDYSWNGLCCKLLNIDNLFEHVYEKLGGEPAALCYVFHNNPNLLFENRWLNSLIRKLISRIPKSMCRKLFYGVRDGAGRTLFFDQHVGADFWKVVYQDRATDLYAALSIKDECSQTALHCNTEITVKLLAMFYAPKRKSKLIKILNARDNLGRTALDMAIGITRSKLIWIKEQATKNYYVLYDAPEVVIAYTKVKRENADEEAISINRAFRQIAPRENITFQNTFKHEKITKLIREKAAKTPSALIVTLMAHGRVGTIYDCDGKEIKLGDIEEAMCSNPQLKNKPKILIIQCCQIRDEVSESFNETPKQSGSLSVAGRSRVDASPSCVNRSPFVPRSPNFCAITSCMPGEAADRNLFIPILADLLEIAEPNKNIIQLVQEAGGKMSSVGKDQTPLVVSTLKADFNPKAGFYSNWNMI